MVTCKRLEYFVYILVCVSAVSALKVIKSHTYESLVSIGGAEILDSNLSGLDVFTLCMNVKTLQFTNKFQTLLYLPSDYSLLPLLIGTTPASCDDWLMSVIPGKGTCKKKVVRTLPPPSVEFFPHFFLTGSLNNLSIL